MSFVRVTIKKSGGTENVYNVSEGTRLSDFFEGEGIDISNVQVYDRDDMDVAVSLTSVINEDVVLIFSPKKVQGGKFGEWVHVSRFIRRRRAA